MPHLLRVQRPRVLFQPQDFVPEATFDGFGVCLPILGPSLVLPWHKEDVDLLIAEDKLVDLQA